MSGCETNISCLPSHFWEEESKHAYPRERPVDMGIVDRNPTLLLIQKYFQWFSAWELKLSLGLGHCFQISTALILEQVTLSFAVQIYFILQTLNGVWQDVLKARYQQSRREEPWRMDFKSGLSSKQNTASKVQTGFSSAIKTLSLTWFYIFMENTHTHNFYS